MSTIYQLPTYSSVASLKALLDSIPRLAQPSGPLFESYRDTCEIPTLLSDYPSAGLFGYEIPLNGKSFFIDEPSEHITIGLTDVPTVGSNLIGSAIIYLNQGASPVSVALPESILWRHGLDNSFDMASTFYRILFTNDPFGNIHGDFEKRSLAV